MMPTSRASSAIYAILKAETLCRKGVVVPANICPAAIFPIIYAGYNPVFCDVDRASGNISYDLLYECLTGRDDIGACLIPHMFGNPVRDIKKISEHLSNRGILFIEDCASSLGARNAQGEFVGFSGDYSIYSFGHSKTIDIGFGGILASPYRDLDACACVLDGLPMEDGEFERKSNEVSKLYRTLRNFRATGTFESDLFRSIIPIIKPLYLFDIEQGKKNEILSEISQLSEVLKVRRGQQTVYDQVFKKHGFGGLVYKFERGAVPWRFVFFVNEELRQEVINECLQNQVPISDWYPSVEQLFGLSNSCSRASRFGKTVLNLPISVEEDSVGQYAETVCEILGKYNYPRLASL